MIFLRYFQIYIFNQDIIFADDGALLVKGTNPQEIKKQLQILFDRCVEWGKDELVEFSQKTFTFAFTLDPSPPDFSLVFPDAFDNNQKQIVIQDSWDYIWTPSLMAPITDFN